MEESAVYLDSCEFNEITEQLKSPKATPFYFFLKRFFDVLISGFGMIVLSPLMLVIAIIVKAEDHGTIIFKQTRLTKNGKKFTMYKFRSMCMDAENRFAEIVDRNELNGPAFKCKSDPRITRIGHFIRKTSMDELPQLFNVLKGDMSIIGPRPPLPREVVQYNEYQMHRLDVKCGLACIHEICGDNEEKDFSVWVEQDLQYISSQSLVLDIKLMIKMIVIVLLGRGAC